MSNPDNLPIIDEPSLHEIVRRVKKWQDKCQELEQNNPIGISQEHIIDLIDSDPDFQLVFCPKEKKYLPIDEYLEFESSENNTITIRNVELHLNIIRSTSIAKSLKFINVTFVTKILFYCLIIEEIYFFDCLFEEKFDIFNCKINEYFLIEKSNFEKKVEFSSTSFFYTCYFSKNTFVNDLELLFCTFHKYSPDILNNCFEKALHLHHSQFLCKTRIAGFLNDFKPKYNHINFSHSTFKENFTLEANLEPNQKLTVDFSESHFEKKLYFSVLQDSKENYQNTTLGLYHTSFADFVCDDRNLAEIKLFYSENKKNRVKEIEDNVQIEQSLKQAEIRNVIEQAIAERRVFRKILQDLNWGDKADEQ